MQHPSDINTVPKHVPYGNGSKPFEIGLRPIDVSDWIEMDAHHGNYLEKKKHLLTKMPDRVFVAEKDTKEAQQEVLDLLGEYLPVKYPEKFTRSGDQITISQNGDVIDLKTGDHPPLWRASLLVQEDLVIMRKSEKGWRLVAASVCFPSSWVLKEKFSKPMHEVHAPVPGFGTGTRNAMMIERIFDNLLVEVPVERFNWSIYADDALYHDDRAGEHFNEMTMQQGLENFLRVERQTLRKLPESSVILFTISIHIDPISILEKRTDRAEIARGFIASLNTMSQNELAYKGIGNNRDLVIRRLEEYATT